MDTLKNDLEQAIPHFDTGSVGTGGLMSDGRQALRQRRARVCAALTTGGLAVAGVALGATVVLTQGGQQGTNGATPGGAAEAPRLEPPTQPMEATISLASLQKVAAACGELELDAGSTTLTSGGQPAPATDEVNGDGWSAAQFACGSDLIRIVQSGDRAAVGRYADSEDESLGAWAEDNVGRLRQ